MRFSVPQAWKNCVWFHACSYLADFYTTYIRIIRLDINQLLLYSKLVITLYYNIHNSKDYIHKHTGIEEKIIKLKKNRKSAGFLYIRVLCVRVCVCCFSQTCAKVTSVKVRFFMYSCVCVMSIESTQKHYKA